MRLVLAAALALSVTPGLAADLPVASTIAAVTVYPDGATVTRAIDYEVPAGEATLVLSDLPARLDQASLRLEGVEGAGVSIGGVDARVVTTPTPGPDAALAAAIEEAQDRRNAIAGEIAALKTKKGFIERIAKSGDLFSGSEKGAHPVDASFLRATWTVIGEDLASVNEAVRLAEVRARDVDLELARLAERRDGRPQSEQRMQLRMTLSSDVPAKGRLRVSYVIGGASWTPLYDARLDPLAGRLEIVRRAQISQSTGEDWAGVALTVSTARARAGASVAAAEPLIVSFFLPETVYVPAPSPDAAEAQDRASKPSPRAAGSASPALKKSATEREAVAGVGGFQSSWEVPGPTTIPSGPVSRSLRLASFTSPAEVVARAVPAADRTAYLEARFTHGEAAPLYPGTVTLYREGIYVGQAGMPSATPGEDVRLGFGGDDRIKVERVVTRKIETDSATRPTKTDRREFKIMLRNGRASPIRIFVEEALPVSESGDIKVETLPQQPPANERNAGNRRGVSVWTLDIPQGESREIKFGYRVTWPADSFITLE
jgi:uncharacterized protein (TIGR02231 family)